MEMYDSTTTETQRTRRLHREERKFVGLPSSSKYLTTSGEPQYHQPSSETAEFPRVRTPRTLANPALELTSTPGWSVAKVRPLNSDLPVSEDKQCSENS